MVVWRASKTCPADIDISMGDEMALGIKLWEATVQKALEAD